jgi:ubiquitin carboxyl-terminal hydrolase 10
MMTPDVEQSALPAQYTLYGVLYHHGTSARRGHYTVDVLQANAHDGSGEAWLHIDDENVSTVRHEDVFGRHDDERADGRCAYMLFYRHATSTQTP